MKYIDIHKKYFCPVWRAITVAEAYLVIAVLFVFSQAKQLLHVFPLDTKLSDGCKSSNDFSSYRPVFDVVTT